MFAAIRAFLSRHSRWIFGTAIAVKVINTGVFGLFGGGSVERIPAFGGLINGLSSLVVLVAVFLAFRWLARRFLFNVSRRLGLAFLFVGVFPLLWFVFFVFGIGATVVLHLASHDSLATLEEIIAETEFVAERAHRAALGAPSPGAFREGWQSLAGVVGSSGETQAFVWVGAPSAEPGGIRLDRDDAERGPERSTDVMGAGAPPDWVRRLSFGGLVAFADTVSIAATRPGELSDGRPLVTLVVEPLGDRVAQRITERTGIIAERIPVERFVTDWRGDRAAAHVDTLPHSLDEPSEDGTEADDEREGDLHLTLSGGDAESVLTTRVVDWESGDIINVEADVEPFDILPVYKLSFDAMDYVRAHFMETGQGGLIWMITKWLGITTLGMMLVASIIGIVLTTSVTRSVNALHKGTKKVAAGDLDHHIAVKSKDQLGALAGSFNEMTDSVKRLLEEKAEKDRLVHEMEIAAEVQTTMLPERFPTIPGLEGAARCIMAKEVGGDFYDFIPITPTRIGFAIGDVSGKGVSAALVMSNVMSSLRSLLASDSTRGPGELLRQLNQILHRATAPDRFVTLFYAEYDLGTANLRYANAGHDWPMLVSPEGQLVLDLESSGLMLGALPEIQLTEHEIKLEPGDVVVAYSDGLVDTVNENDEPFERERAQAVIAQHIADSPARVVDAVSRSLREWRGDAEEVDDVTLIVLKRVALPGAEGAHAASTETAVVG